MENIRGRGSANIALEEDLIKHYNDIYGDNLKMPLRWLPATAEAMLCGTDYLESVQKAGLGHQVRRTQLFKDIRSCIELTSQKNAVKTRLEAIDQKRKQKARKRANKEYWRNLRFRIRQRKREEGLIASSNDRDK